VSRAQFSAHFDTNIVLQADYKMFMPKLRASEVLEDSPHGERTRFNHSEPGAGNIVGRKVGGGDTIHIDVEYIST
jgi:hypothetical protein